MSTTLIPSMTSTARRRRFDLDVDSGRAMSEWSLGFEVADNGIFVGEETTVVRTLTIDNKNVTILVQRALLYESMEKY
ncbi:hypothetical protein YC2023_038942 [Brassica napus]